MITDASGVIPSSNPYSSVVVARERFSNEISNLFNSSNC
jgi:hypothetical protein